MGRFNDEFLFEIYVERNKPLLFLGFVGVEPIAFVNGCKIVDVQRSGGLEIFLHCFVDAHCRGQNART